MKARVSHPVGEDFGGNVGEILLKSPQRSVAESELSELQLALVFNAYEGVAGCVGVGGSLSFPSGSPGSFFGGESKTEYRDTVTQPDVR